ncbi:MAG: carboxymuconolactone decarboxylase family protein [Solirubrobacteraceae bacterium]
MAELPDPRPTATAAALDEMRRIAEVRTHSDGRAELAAVYVAMFNNPAVAHLVGTLGEHLRFGGTLPDDVRELAILRYAGRRHLTYEWAHHVRPATLAGVDETTIAALAADAVPSGLDHTHAAVVEAVDQIVADDEIAPDTQRILTDQFGNAGVVELVALCGLYALVGYMTTAFAIEPEPGLPQL